MCNQSSNRAGWGEHRPSLMPSPLYAGYKTNIDAREQACRLVTYLSIILIPCLGLAPSIVLQDYRTYRSVLCVVIHCTYACAA